ncbi:MAG TPA: acetate--CoA ligase family protein, partial [Ktedonobacteraceae bacterium]|nr:acetate--CoA ligase family protein [Ktedonobacteraceae bacterium]
DGHFTGPVHYVNPRGGTVHGLPAFSRLSDIGEPVDLALIVVPPPAVLSVLQEMDEVGIRNAVLITAGFGELGAEGKQMQQELVDFAHAHDIAFLGPNCLGYINVAHNIPAMPSPFPPVIEGHVAVIAQSGALTSTLFNYAYMQHVGINALASTGNEAVLSISELMDYFVEDEATKVIALFVEAIRNPEHFIAAARHALANGKPIVAFKIGRSERSAEVAQAHTGALVGDDRVIDALFRQLGIIRVNSIEELLITSGTLAQTGVLPGNRLGFVALSGGSCDSAADYAEQYGIELPAFSEETKQGLRTLLPALGSAHNPLDTTGAVVNDQLLFERIVAQVGSDPNLDVLVCANSLPSESQGDFINAFSVKLLNHIVAGLRTASHPAFLLDFVNNDVAKHAREAVEQNNWPLLPGGVDRGLQALGKAMWWSEHYRRSQTQQMAAVDQEHFALNMSEATKGTWPESQVRLLLEEYGIPVVPARLVTSAEQAVEAAHEVNFPVALKVVSPDIMHKSDIGGVRLNLQNEQEVRDAFQQIMQAVNKANPAARIEGILVSPMRTGGIELLVGIIRDAAWGQVMAVGLGGIWVVTLKDTSLRVLPVSREDIHIMLNELQGKALLRGTRGSAPADMERLVEVIYRTSKLAQALGDRLVSLEINPLRVAGSQIEALDALIDWGSTGK